MFLQIGHLAMSEKWETVGKSKPGKGGSKSNGHAKQAKKIVERPAAPRMEDVCKFVEVTSDSNLTLSLCLQADLSWYRLAVHYVPIPIVIDSF